MSSKLLKCCLQSSNSAESLNDDIPGDPIYRNTNNSELQSGYTFLITGKIPVSGDRFLIDFCLDNENKDIALRLAGRASTSSLGRSSRVNKVWGIGEVVTASPITFDMGWNFEIQVLFTTKCIFIAHESMHVAEYAHRVPFTAIRSIEIRGDIKDVAVEHKFNTEYPLRRRPSPHICQLSDRAKTSDAGDVESATNTVSLKFKKEEYLRLPYYVIFSRGFLKVDDSVIVNGRISANFKMIKVSLQFSAHIWPSPTKALQLLFRSTTKGEHGETGEPTLTLDTYAENEWTGEVKFEFDNRFRPGAEFNLRITYKPAAFEIVWNNRHLYSYRHILNPEHINTCLVEGNIDLADVLIKHE